MFRTLRVRLITMYVLMAITLVVIVATAITAFSLSRLALGTNDALTALVRLAPEVSREALVRTGNLRAAAPDIVRRLARPGLRVVVMEAASGALVPLAVGESGTHAHPPAAEKTRGFERPKFPFRLNVLLGLHPRFIDIPGGQIAVYPDPRPLENAMSEFWIAMIPVGLLVVLSALFFGRYIADQALRPLTETTDSLRSFAQGDFTPRSITAAGSNEIVELVAAYNGAAAQVAAAFKERSEAEREMRRFIADASHELRTPLTVIMGFIEVLRRRSGTADAVATARMYDTMQAEGRRMKMLVEKLIALARLDNLGDSGYEELDIGKLVAGIVASFEALQGGSRIVTHLESGVRAYAYESEVHEIVGNLLENALKYAPGVPIDVSVRGEHEWAVIVVVDAGPGLPEEEREHVFDRFYRGSNRGEAEGFGLGLAIVKRAVEKLNGLIALESKAGEGCRFTIRLPRVRGKRAA